MSKQSEAKKNQNYKDKPLSTRCRECKHFEETRIEKKWGGWSEKLKCTIGNFVVKANSICDLFDRKPE